MNKKIEIHFESNPKQIKFLSQSHSKVVALYGGAGAGKSYAIAQFLITYFLGLNNKHFIVMRKTNPSLKLSAYPLIISMLDEYNVPYKLNRSEQVIEFGKNKMFFKSLDDKEKIKSSEFNYAWMEEATEFTHDDFLQVKLRLRRYTHDRNQLFLSFNPIDVPWLESEIKKEDVSVLRVTYKDNRFTNQEYIDTLENLKNEDEAYYKIYALGQFARIKGLVYHNWDTDFENVKGKPFYGIDFGFNNPTALVKIIQSDGEYYVDEMLYQTHLTNSELIERMKELEIESGAPIYCDSAEPNRIREMEQAGFNVMGAKKMVKDGIDFVKRFKLHIRGENLRDEIRTYKWKEKKGETLDEPVKFQDHLMDAMRYAIFTHSLMGSVHRGRKEGRARIIKGR